MVVPLTSFLHLGSPMTALWASISLAPVPLLGAVQGFLQGTRRFGTLAIVFISAALLRLVAAVSAASAGLGVEGVVAGIALAAILAAAVARSLVQVAPPSAKTSRPGLGGPLLEVFGVIPVIGGLLLLASTDVLLARHYLSATEAGTYAVGSIVTKVTFWAPQFVAVLSFSDLADPQRREAALRKALSLIVGVTAVATLATWVLARPLVHLVLGRAYLSLAPQAWLFALLGGLLALGQLLMTAGIASHQGGLARRLWLCIALQIVLVSAYWHHSVRQVVACSLACTLALVIISGRSAVLTAKRHTGASALD